MERLRRGVELRGVDRRAAGGVSLARDQDAPGEGALVHVEEGELGRAREHARRRGRCGRAARGSSAVELTLDGHLALTI